MKITKLIFLLSILIASEFSYSQSAPQEQNQIKYWNYRNRLKREFNLVGPLQAESVPMQRRQFANDLYPWVPCYDELNEGDGTGYHSKGLIQWGDALAHHGTYLAVLASEYRLLKNNNQPAQETLIELYYSINALSRIDKQFETYFGSTGAQIESGVLMRDDVYFGFEDNWAFLEPLPTTAQPSYLDLVVLARAQTKFKVDAGDNKDCNTATFQNHNVWSKDHISNLLFGLCMIKKLTDNVYVQPTAGDNGFYIHDEISRIVDIWMTKFSEGHQWEIERDLGICNWVTLTESMNWFIINDVTNSIVSKDDGGHLGNVAWPFNEMAKYITGNDYQKNFTHTYDNPSVCPYELEEITFWAGLHTEWNVYYLSHVADYQDGLHQATPDQEHYLKVINNLATVFPIAAVSGLVDHQHIGNLTKERDDPAKMNPYGIWEMAYSVFHDESSIWSQTKIEDMLNLAPFCTNPANGHNDNQILVWTSGNIAIHGYRPHTHNTAGYYAGTDYMLMYNLYRLLFSSNPNQDGGYSERSCECKKADVVEITIGGSGSEPNIWPSHAVEITSPLTTSYTVKVMHERYKSYVHENEYLKLYDYIIEDLTVGTGGTLFVQSDLKITNTSELFIENSGIVSIKDALDRKKTVVIEEGSVVRIGSDGFLEVGSETKVVFKAGSSLIIEPGGELKLSGNGKVIIEHDAKLICGTGTLNLSSSGSQLEIKGAIHVPMNQTFEPIGIGTLVYNNNVPQSYHNGQHNLIADGQGAQVSFLSINIQVQPWTYIYPYNMELVEIINSSIKLGHYAHVNIGDKLICENSSFGAINPSIGAHNGLRVYGQDGPDPLDSRVKINNCTFSDGKYGVQALQNFGTGKSIAISNCQFDNLAFGIYVYDEGLYAFGNSFTGCIKGILTNLSSAFVNLESNSFGHPQQLGMQGTQVEGTGFRSIIAGNVYYNLSKGHYGIGGSQGFICNSFVGNTRGVEGGGNVLINWTDELKNGLRSGFSWLGSGHNLVNAQNVGGSHFLLGGQSKLYLRNGFNSFNISAPNPIYYTQGYVGRSERIVNGYLAIDIEYMNNSWINYPPNSFGKFENDPVDLSKRINLGLYKQSSTSWNMYPPQYPDVQINPVNVSTLVCPVASWNSAYDYSSFQPGQFPNVIYMKNLNSGGIIDPYDNVVGNVSGGIYNGQNYGSTINTLYPDLTNNFNNNRYTPNSVSDLLNFADLVKNSWTSEENWHVNEELMNDLTHFAISYFKDPNLTETNKQLILSGYLSVVQARDLWLDNTQEENSIFLNSMKVQSRIFEAQVYRVVKDYSNSLQSLNTAYTYSSSVTAPLVNHYYCLIENEKRVHESEISVIQFADNISNCHGQLDSMSSEFQSVMANLVQQEPAPAFSFVISPNPAIGTLSISIEVEDPIASLQITVLNQYGIEAHSNTLTNLATGITLYQVNLTTNDNGIYYIILTDGNDSDNKPFILTH